MLKQNFYPTAAYIYLYIYLYIYIYPTATAAAGGANPILSDTLFTFQTCQDQTRAQTPASQSQQRKTLIDLETIYISNSM